MKTNKLGESHRTVMLSVVLAVAHAALTDWANAHLVVAKTGSDDNTCATESAPA